MKRGPQELCPENIEIPLFGSRPSRTAIHPATVYVCDSPQYADERLGGQQPGYVYQRDGHPNADLLAEKCRQLHGADQAIVTASGMAAIALAFVSQLQSGDHVLLSNRLYGRTVSLLSSELSRLGIQHSVADFSVIESTQRAMLPNTKMLVVETISNPTLRVADLQALANMAHAANAKLLVDNTFASPVACQPFKFGADLVVESLTKIMNGHGDVTLGLLCGKDDCWERVPFAQSTWGFHAGPFECWLAERGIATLYLRMKAAAQSAAAIANFLCKANGVQHVDYPGLPDHPDRELAIRQFESGSGEPLFGNMVTFLLNGESPALAADFIAAARDIPFCPSLGDLITTLSHPLSSSHRNLPSEACQQLGIHPNTIRLSIGLESSEFIEDALREALDGLDF